MSELPPGFVLDQASDVGLPPGFVLDKPEGSSLGGVAKSLGTGLAEGVIGLAGLPGDAYHLGLRALGDNLTPESRFGSNAIKKNIEAYTGDFYKPQGTLEETASKIGQFAPAVIGGPETMAVKFAGRVAAPAVASEIGGKVAGPYGDLAGALVGGVGGSLAAQKFKAMAAARQAAVTAPSAENLLKTAGGQFDQARDMNVIVKPDFATNAAADMRQAIKSFDPEVQSAVYKAADRLENLGVADRATSGIVGRMAPEPATTKAPTNIPQNITGNGAPPKAQSLLEFIASKGGLGPDAELGAIGAHGHTVNVEGVGRRKLVRQGGWPLDYAREAAEEAGYLRGNHNGTSTVNDLLDAMDAEMRGQKRYPAGYEGTVTKREGIARSEREQHELDRHMQGLESDLAAAGHGQLGADVRQRAVRLMSNEGMDADTAVERALRQLEQEDNAVSRGAGFPGDRALPPKISADAAGAMGRPVPMNEVENIRKQLVSLKTSPDASTREAARQAIGSLQRSQMALTPADTLAGDAGAFTRLTKDAIGNWAAGKRSNTITGKIDLGNLNAATAGSGANEDNALRQAFKQLARPVNNTNTPKWQRLGFDKAEGAAIEQAARGTTLGNAARYLGKAAPTGIVSAAMSGGAGHMAGGPIGAVALPAAGYVAKKIGDLSTKRAVAAVDSLVRSRSPLAAQVATQLPPHIVQQLPAKSQRLLQAMILADPTLSQLSQQQRQPVGQSNAY